MAAALVLLAPPPALAQAGQAGRVQPLPLQAARAPFELPPQASEIAHGIFDLGFAFDPDGRLVQGIAFVHGRENATHKDGRPHGGPKGGADSGNRESKCFALIARGASWKSVEPYLLDTTNGSGLSDAELADWVELGLETWEAAAAVDPFAIFGQRVAGTVDGVDSAAPDGQNEVLFGSLGDPGTIAVTITWGIFGGPPQARELVEWDAIFSDAFDWGDADVSPAVMDFLNIAVHEIGHAAGFTHPDSTCTDETMYAFAAAGETKKRDLHAGDITGARKLYE
jgi:hypothetical protein